MKIKDDMADKGLKLRKRLEEVLNSETGFIILADGKKITDFYQGICPDCVVEQVEESVNDFAEKFGTLPISKKN